MSHFWKQFGRNDWNGAKWVAALPVNAAGEPVGRSRIEDALFALPFHLCDVPNHSVLRLAATNIYRLYVNGVSCAFGPRKGDANCEYYDEVDIAPCLRAGDNLLALRVETVQGSGLTETEYRVSSLVPISGDCRMLVEGRAAGVELSTGKAIWRACRDDSRTHHYGEPDPYLGPSFEEFHGAKLPRAWMTDAAICEAWPQAKPLREPGITSCGEIRGTSLLPRPIPFLDETPIVDYRAFPMPGGTLLEFGKPVPAGESACCLIDARELVTAFVEADCTGVGARISFTYGEAFFFPENVPAGANPSLMSFQDGERWRKRNRDDTTGRLFGGEDRVFCDGACHYAPLWFRTFRYILVQLEAGSTAATIEIPELRRCNYALRVESGIRTKDKDANWLWDISLKTLKNCMHATFEDCPYYEQLQYICDGKLEMDFLYSVSTDTRLAETGVWDFHSSLKPFGLVACAYPAAYAQIIPSFAAQFVWMVAALYEQTGDREAARFYLPTCDAVLEYYERHMAPCGLVGNLEYWTFVDWSPEWNPRNGAPDALRRGCASIDSLIYIRSLALGAHLADETGRHGLASEYRARARKLSEVVLSLCWREDRGMLAEGPQFDQFSQHAQALGVLTGVLTGERARKAMLACLQSPGVVQCSLSWSHYLYEALHRCGLHHEVRKRMDALLPLRASGFTTLPEWAFDSARSDCHGWSATALYQYIRYVLGVRPGADGWTRILVQPTPMGYSEFAGTAATPAGKVDVDWRIENGVFRLKLTTPAATTVVLPDGRAYTAEKGEYEF